MQFLVPGANDPTSLYAVALFVIFVLVLARLAGLTRQGRELPYRLREGFLSPAELSFYGVLRLAVQDRYAICPKVRLADLFFVTNGDISSLNRITAKHADFVLCEPLHMRPVIGIELDDASHRAPDRIERDEFVNEVFRAAGLPLLRIPVRQSYNPNDLQGLVLNVIEGKVTPLPRISPPENGAPPLCPTCGIPMLLRTARKGSNRGCQFYGCANYPDCRQISRISDRDRNDAVRQTGGRC